MVYIFHAVPFRASSFNFQYLTVYLLSSNRFSILFAVFPSLLPAFSFISFNKVSHKAVSTQDVSNAVSLPLFCCTKYISFLLNSMQYFLILYTITSTDLLHASPEPHFRIFQVIPFNLPKCPNVQGRRKRCSKCRILFDFL
jgi:hypothetical protein